MCMTSDSWTRRFHQRCRATYAAVLEKRGGRGVKTRQTERQKDRKTERQTERQTDRKRERGKEGKSERRHENAWMSRDAGTPCLAHEEDGGHRGVQCPSEKEEAISVHRDPKRDSGEESGIRMRLLLG